MYVNGTYPYKHSVFTFSTIFNKLREIFNVCYKTGSVIDQSASLQTKCSEHLEVLGKLRDLVARCIHS